MPLIDYHQKIKNVDELIDAKQNLMSDKISDLTAIKHDLEVLQKQRNDLKNEIICELNQKIAEQRAELKNLR